MASAPQRPRPGRLAAKCFWLTGRQAVSFGFSALLPSDAFADGIPFPGQIGFQEAATPIQQEIEFFHNWILLPIILAICLFVLGLLLYVIFRFNEKANPVPAQTTHHSKLEVAWTVLPVMILVATAIPSFHLLTDQLVVPEADVRLR
jgi:cytochrome c oxidase subunit 2